LAAAELNVAIPDRYRWAVEILDVQPDDMILEIGCGYGHSIPLICEKLTTGHLTAIDRSAKMVAATSLANRQFIDSGRVTLLHQDLLDDQLPASTFDKIFLFNINIFWMDPREELAEIRRLLKPHGRFYIFHQPPPGHELIEFETVLRMNLEKRGFGIVNALQNVDPPVLSVCLISTSSKRSAVL
jgi:SAM-dependent methyltransferase